MFANNSARVLFTLLLTGAASAQAAESLWGGSFSNLNGRIIRSIDTASFDQNLVIAGNKGTKPGDAKLFLSSNGGVSWQFLNRNQSLAKLATDVQAVAIASPTTMFAGTWKHGMFRSVDSGNTFAPVGSFPFKDIRDIAITKDGRIVAATGTNGLLHSTDNGATWANSSHSKGFFWSVNPAGDGNSLLAASTSTGLYLSENQGSNWQNVLQAKGIYQGTSDSRNKIIAAAGDAGLYITVDGGNTWSRPPELRNQKLSSVIFKRNSNNEQLLVGGWNGGLWEYSIAQARLKSVKKDLPVLHLLNTRDATLSGTWGKGLHIFPKAQRTEYLVEAAKAGSRKTIGALLAAGADPDSTDKNANTALTFASRDGHLDIAKDLISKGANVDAVDDEGVTPLILASFKNYPDIVKLLLQNKANTNIVDNFGRTAVDYAARRGANDPILKLLNQ